MARMAFPSFTDVLDRHLAAKGISLRAFARSAGVPVSLLSRLKKGQRAVPVGRIEAWADHLGLRGDERAEFIDSAMWTAVPKRLRPWFEAKLSGAKPIPRRR